MTDIYGLREYRDGARLLTHVDREATHALSLIVNVAQGDIRKPWPVEIYDHADRLHEITMDVGDIVYYESARCLHGRMQPLEGGYYVNLFAHYRPVGGDTKWFEKENPPESVAPRIDLGDCVVDNNHTTKCTSGVPTPYLSTSFEKLEGPKDLFKHWQDITEKISTTTLPNEEL